MEDMSIIFDFQLIILIVILVMLIVIVSKISSLVFVIKKQLGAKLNSQGWNDVRYICPHCKARYMNKLPACPVCKKEITY